MHILYPHLNTETHHKNNSDKYVAREVMDLFMALGVEVITEADRIQAGLEPRDHNGMTLQEIQIMDTRLIKAMLEPMQPMFMNKEIKE